MTINDWRPNDKPMYVSRGEWDLAPSVEERIEEYISGQIEKNTREKLYKAMNMCCFE